MGERRYPAVGGYTTDQARELAALSRSLGRQIGLVLDRQGKAHLVLLGDASGLFIPELPRNRTGSGRLRGLRLLHTHLNQDGLSHEDLMDMLFLRLDSIGAITVNPHGDPVQFHSAHLLPTSEKGLPYRVHDAVPWDMSERDFIAEAEALEAELSRMMSERLQAGESNQRAILVSVSAMPRAIQQQNIDELTELARTAGVSVTGTLIQRVASVHPRHILGKGKLSELEVLALQGQASMIIFDGELTPAQLTNLANLTERQVLDRTQLILDIFATRASSRAGKWQVELAQLQYTLPRLVGKNRAMDRLMGGIGGRGPGETKLETDRRRVRDRVAKVRRELENLREQRAFTRARRAQGLLPVAALVGYTNAGKSTLLNSLTRSDVLAENKLFATLDPTTRRLRFPHDHELVLADTVGFIRNLPKELTEAFQATLEELHAADLLIHVLDASHVEMERQAMAVEDILADMKLLDTPRLTLLNKWDLLSESQKVTLQERWPEALPISGLTREGFEALAEYLQRMSRPDTAFVGPVRPLPKSQS